MWEEEEGGMYRRKVLDFTDEKIAYRFSSKGSYGLDTCSRSQFIKDLAHKLVDSLEFPAPKKMIKKSQALIRDSYLGADRPSVVFFISREEADNHYEKTVSCKIIQWPIVVNGVEQWVEVPSDE
jgi:hypothetical protein